MATISSTPSPGSGTITSTGLGSGLDVNGLVSKLIAAESQPLKQLNAKEATYQARLTAYGTVKSTLSAFQSAVSGLSSANAFQTLAANSADTSVYTATAGLTAVAGSYDIEVVNLAASQKLVSGAFTAVTDVVGTGTLTFQFGTTSGSTFTANSNKSSQDVIIDSSHSSLSGIRDAVNAADIGVTATIINDGTGYKLLFTSNDTGADNSLKVTTSSDGDGNDLDNSGLSQLAYDPAGSAGNGKNLTETVAAQDATLNVDGITGIKKSSNTITDLIQGITLNLVKPSASGVSAKLTVGSDPTSVKGLVQKFVSAYNDVNKTLSDVTSYDPKTQKGGLLLGDSTILSLERHLRSLLTSNIDGLSGNYNLLSDIGVSFQKDGTLSLDSKKLETALNTSPEDVASIFATVGRASDSLVNYSSATSETQPGSYAVTVTRLATQGYYGGVSTSALANTSGTFTSPLVIDSSNDTLMIKIDGTLSGTINLAQGSYTTASALSAEIQSKINGDATLAAAGVGVSVSFDNAAAKFTITSNSYGSSTGVDITSVGSGSASTLGLSAVSGTAGVDVAGTINGVGATGSGQYLTGAYGNDSSGLKIQIAGGALGSRGTISYSKGYAEQLDSFIADAIGSTGAIAARTDGITKSVADIKDQVTQMNNRLAVLQKQYLAQFNAMDTLVAQMRSTSNFLTQQLAALSNLTPTGR